MMTRSPFGSVARRTSPSPVCGAGAAALPKPRRREANSATAAAQRNPRREKEIMRAPCNGRRGAETTAARQLQITGLLLSSHPLELSSHEPEEVRQDRNSGN